MLFHKQCSTDIQSGSVSHSGWAIFLREGMKPSPAQCKCNPFMDRYVEKNKREG